MDQQFINWIMAAAGALMGIIIKSLFDGIRDLQKADKEITDRIGKIEVLVVGEYIKREDINVMMGEVFRKLDKIYDRLDEKADK